MPLAKTKTSKKNLPNLPKVESSYAKRSREYDERDKKEKDDKEKEKKAKEDEENRVEKLVIPYLDNLQEQIVQKNLLYFWAFADEPGFIKHKDLDITNIKQFLKKDIHKYKNRIITSISFHFYHNDKIDKNNLCRSLGIYLCVDITAYPINDKGIILNNSNSVWGCTLAWHINDFKLSKFSFKLLETITKAIVIYHKSYPSIFGIPLTFVVEDLKKQGLDFGNILQPLPGSL